MTFLCIFQGPVELSWSISTSPFIARAGHTSTLLSNGVTVYIGGHDITNKNIDFSQEFQINIFF